MAPNSHIPPYRPLHKDWDDFYDPSKFACIPLMTDRRVTSDSGREIYLVEIALYIRLDDGLIILRDFDQSSGDDSEDHDWSREVTFERALELGEKYGKPEVSQVLASLRAEARGSVATLPAAGVPGEAAHGATDLVDSRGRAPGVATGGRGMTPLAQVGTGPGSHGPGPAGAAADGSAAGGGPAVPSYLGVSLVPGCLQVRREGYEAKVDLARGKRHRMYMELLIKNGSYITTYAQISSAAAARGLAAKVSMSSYYEVASNLNAKLSILSVVIENCRTEGYRLKELVEGTDPATAQPRSDGPKKKTKKPAQPKAVGRTPKNARGPRGKTSKR